MSAPSTPHGGKRYAGTQQSNNSDGISWFTIIGGVMGELLNNWGIIGALKRRGWGGASGIRSTPSTPPPYARSNYAEQEHIELAQLQPSEFGDGISVGVRRRSNNVPRKPRTRHSYHEGTSTESYILTTALIHSLKYGSGKTCDEDHCHLCKSKTDKQTGVAYRQELTDRLNLSTLYSRSVSQETSKSPPGSPISSTSFQYAQISPSGSPRKFRLLKANMQISLSDITSQSEISSDMSGILDHSSSSAFYSADDRTLSDSGTLTGAISGNTCSTFTDETFSDTLTAPSNDTMSSSLYSLPSNLDKNVRPLMSGGSLILLPRRPSLVDSHPTEFQWEETNALCKSKMGITESTQKNSLPWGPSKSKSTPQFVNGKSRSSATLPTRTSSDGTLTHRDPSHTRHSKHRKSDPLLESPSFRGDLDGLLTPPETPDRKRQVDLDTVDQQPVTEEKQTQTSPHRTACRSVSVPQGKPDKNRGRSAVRGRQKTSSRSVPTEVVKGEPYVCLHYESDKPSHESQLVIQLNNAPQYEMHSNVWFQPNMDRVSLFRPYSESSLTKDVRSMDFSNHDIFSDININFDGIEQLCINEGDKIPMKADKLRMFCDALDSDKVNSTFPILRLPKAHSQPPLVDILKGDSCHTLPKSAKIASPQTNNHDEGCNFTCHEQCHEVVSIDCKGLFAIDNDSSTDEENPLDSAVETEEKHEEEALEKDMLDNDVHVSTLRRTVTRIQSQAVISSEIEEWVEKCSSGHQSLQIAKEPDGSYRGCLRIHLNLSRPINIVAGTRPPSIYDILQEDRTIERTLTSFYMPRDAVKAIHITSTTTTRQVIVALLKKFKVVDNPQKFALYEKSYDVGQAFKATLRRLVENECPLVLAISWGAQNVTNKRLVLQENDTADIQWDAFSLPELDNFLRILDKEEEEYKNQIRDKYTLLKSHLCERLAYLQVAS